MASCYRFLVHIVKCTKFGLIHVKVMGDCMWVKGHALEVLMILLGYVRFSENLRENAKREKVEEN